MNNLTEWRALAGLEEVSAAAMDQAAGRRQARLPEKRLEALALAGDVEAVREYAVLLRRSGRDIHDVLGLFALKRGPWAARIDIHGPRGWLEAYYEGLVPGKRQQFLDERGNMSQKAVSLYLAKRLQRAFANVRIGEYGTFQATGAASDRRLRTNIFVDGRMTYARQPLVLTVDGYEALEHAAARAALKVLHEIGVTGLYAHHFGSFFASDLERLA